MLAFTEERRAAPGVAILARTTSRLSAMLDHEGTLSRILLLQDGLTLPALRPPVLLDTSGMGVVELAAVLEQLACGAVPDWPSRTPLPTIAIVDPLAVAYLRLLMDCPAVVAVVACTVSPLTLATSIRYFGALAVQEQSGPVWIGVPCPTLIPYRHDLGRLLLALHCGVTIAAAAHAAHLSRAGLRRRLDQLFAALQVERLAGYDSVESWRTRLLAALHAPL
ncbi:MAG: hypothetical protein H7Z42_21140 [Roseiflexaceae bacterium]|nr:hypothetical protein [Roseiflexaceae bacterium]